LTGSAKGSRVEPEELERLRAQANYLHRALFGREAPDEVRWQYARVLHRAALVETPRCDLARLMEREVDVEAMEVALRRRNPSNSLTQRFRVLCYLTEARPEYFDRFVNETPALVVGTLTLWFLTLRSLYKLAKGDFLVWVHDVG
jgi:hypothetical protein